MISPLARARLTGGLLAFGTFALGVAAGVWLASRNSDGIDIRVTATDRMPRELERLELTDAERPLIQQALRRGRDRVLRVADAFQGPMQSAVDSTDMEIRAILSDAQRAAFDSARRTHPALRKKRVIDHR
jgi:hypothetical protein